MIGPRTTKEQFFSELIDLDYKGFEGIREAIAAGDIPTCEKIFAKAMRENPSNKILLDVNQWYIDKWTGEGKLEELVIERGLRVLDYIVEATGVRIKFEGKDDIDWQRNPTYNKYREVTYQVVRFADISILAKYYMITKDPKCIQVFIDLVDAFIKKELSPATWTGFCTTMCWRTIDTGGRCGSLTNAMAVFLSCPELPDEFICDVYRSLYEHGERLFSSDSMGNWRIFEIHGLTDFCFACPFYTDTPKWYKYCVDTLIEQLDKQFYPAPVGHQEELAPSYHDGVVRAYISILDDCFERYGVEPPKELLDKLEKGFEMYPHIVRPDDMIPGLNDSSAYIINATLRYAYKYYPSHKDYIWFGSYRKEGEKPKYLSTVVPTIGWTVFRSEWSKDAIWLFFDTGHYGRGHQHDDQLNILLHAYGKEMLTEVGNTPYDASKMRGYCIKSRAHNTIMLNGKEMNDRKFFDDNGLRESYHENYALYPAPKYSFTDDYEVSENYFDRGYGEDMEQMKAIRKVIFVKNGAKYGLKPFFIVVDRFTAPDDNARRYDIMWHLPENIKGDITANTVEADYGDGVGLKMLACDDKAQFVNMRGQMEPYYQGWLCTHKGGVKDEDQIPTDTPVFVGEFEGKRRVVTVLYPSNEAGEGIISATASCDFDALDLTLKTENGEFVLNEGDFK